MRLSEQEIVNAICLHMAERKQILPTQVQVEMLWDEEQGFAAEVTAQGQMQEISAASILEAIERYLLKEHQMRVFRSQIRLDLQDEIIADIE
ncbi:DUF2653 family protein [Paenibacillus ginsengihumi]|uniref:DUF2653 family protein n=1 Tax=Paenibacillus ginsengihumi TaxID=431596 RepID=UPI00038185A2|nr:DUF2653 family protein [Paenibacillus ginsengihumi]